MENNTEKHGSNIESYEGSDAYYEGSDKDYEDFLKQVDGDISASKNAAGVDGGDGAPLGETINIRGVIDMVRRKAGEIGVAAKKIGGGVKEQINDYIAAAAERAEEKKAEAAAGEEPEEDTENTAEPAENELEHTRVITREPEHTAGETAEEDIARLVGKAARAAGERVKSASDAASKKLEEITSVGQDLDRLSENMDVMSSKLDSISSAVNDIGVKQIENRNNYDRGVNDLRVSMNGLNAELSEIGQSTGGIAKLSDAVFDLKNTQQNTKKAIADLEERVIALRKKLTVGVTLISILSVIMIILEIINLLS